MTRQIRLDQVGGYAVEQVEKLIRVSTLQAETKLKERTPVDTGDLKRRWDRTIEPLIGTVFNNLPYAAPVVAGQNFPQSWGGQYRTRRGAEPFLDIVAKDVQTYMETEAKRIAKDS